MHEFKEIKVQPPYIDAYQNVTWKAGNCDTPSKIFILILCVIYMNVVLIMVTVPTKMLGEKSPRVNSQWKENTDYLSVKDTFPLT